MPTFMFRAKVIIFLTLLFYGLLTGPRAIYGQTDPIAAKLKVEGEIEIGANRSLRLKPVVGTAPASPETGDLYFDGSVLRTWDGDSWEVIADEGTIFYDDTTAKIYYRGKDAAWKGIAGGGGENTVATKIVAASNSPNPGRADLVCDGTDDQEKINQAIRELPSFGGAVYLLEGTYNITDKKFFEMDKTGIVLDKSNISLIGTGSGTVLKLVSGASSVKVISASNVSGLLLSKFTIDGNSGTGSSNHGVLLNSVTYSTITDLCIQGMSVNAIVLGDDTGSAATAINNISGNHIKNNNGNGIRVYGTTRVINNIISDNIINDNLGAGLYADMDTGPSGSFNRNIITNNVIKSNTGGADTGGGININIDGQQQSMHNIISGNILDSNTNSDGIGLYGSIFNVVTGNKVASNTNGIYIEGSSYINGAWLSGCNVIANNYIANNTNNGILLGKALDTWHNVIFSNLLYDNSDGLYSASIVLDRFSNDNLLSSNQIIGGGNGIDIIGDADRSSSYNYLFSNLITGSLGIADSGAYTAYTDATKMTLDLNNVAWNGNSTAFAESLSKYSYVTIDNNEPPYTWISITLPKGKFKGDILILHPGICMTLVHIKGGLINNVVFDYDHNDSDEDFGGHWLYGGSPATLELFWSGQYWIQMNNETYY